MLKELTYKLDEFELKINLVDFVPHERSLILQVDREDGVMEFAYNFTTSVRVNEKRLKRLFNSNAECRKLGKMRQVADSCPFKFEVRTLEQLSLNGQTFSFYVKDPHASINAGGVFAPPRAEFNKGTPHA